MKTTHLHKPNLTGDPDGLNITWNSRQLPIPIDLFDMPSLTEADLTDCSFSFWLTVNPKLSDQTIASILSDHRVETFRLSSSKYKDVYEISHDIKRLKWLARDQNIKIALDLSGPKLRINRLDSLSGSGKLYVKAGDQVALITSTDKMAIEDPRLKDLKLIPYKAVIPINQTSGFLLISDGWSQFEITGRDELATYAKALNDTVIENHRGIDMAGLYDQTDQLPKETIQILLDLKTMNILEELDWLCLSFCNSSAIIQEVISMGMPERLKIMAKIESMRGIEKINEICLASDGIMIARGDLAVQTALFQKDILAVEDQIRNTCMQWGKKCVIATRVADSLTEGNGQLINNELYRLKHELIFDRHTCLLLTNETIENTTAFNNYLAIKDAIEKMIV